MNIRLDIKRGKSMYWDEEYNIKQIAEKLDISFWSLYSFMNKNSICRRSPSEANYLANKTKPQFKIREDLNISDDKLKVAGIMLYWAEGTLQGSTVDFVNSDPKMIRLFMRFLSGIMIRDY